MKTTAIERSLDMLIRHFYNTDHTRVYKKVLASFQNTGENSNVLNIKVYKSQNSYSDLGS